jgi:hypothetical protein
MRQLTATLFAIVLICAMSSKASAQELTGYGLKAGLNLANLGGDDADYVDVDKKMKMGFTVGGFVTYSINEMFAVQTEVLYTQKGAKYEDAEGDFEETKKYDYFEIPVLAKFTAPTEGIIKPNLFFGPVLGILRSAKEDGSRGDISWDHDIKDATKSTDFGLVFGAGVDIGMPHSAITIDGRYTMGLTTICEPYTHPETDEEIDCDVKNGVFSFTVGYSF